MVHKKSSSNVIAENRKVFYDYEIIDEFIAGLMLHGHEVKSVRAGNVTLKGSYITVHNNEAWLTNAFIAKYKFAGNVNNYDEYRSRKLLLNKREIVALDQARKSKLNIVPLRIIKSHGLIKIKLVIARGKKKYDKRQAIKKREMTREVSKLKNRIQRS